MEGNRSNDVAEVPTWYERKGSCGTAKDQQQNNFPAVMSVQTGSAQPRNGATVFSQGREPLDWNAASQAPEGRQCDRWFCRPFGAFVTRGTLGSQGLAPLANDGRLFKAEDPRQNNIPAVTPLIVWVARVGTAYS